uniref:Chromo domain-containing protein n=1 Tax=Astyanax mexicanus TaxID=7994 RepID=A0A8B9GZX2_ASTMX
MAGSDRRKSGGPSAPFWEGPETAAQLEAVRSWIGKHYKKYVQADAPSTKSLAGLVVQLLQFQEDAFGRRATSPDLTKLPVSIRPLLCVSVCVLYLQEQCVY